MQRRRERRRVETDGWSDGETEGQKYGMLSNSVVIGFDTKIIKLQILILAPRSDMS